METHGVPFNLLVEATPAFAVVVHGNKIRYLNRTASGMIGAEGEAQAVGCDFLSFVHEEDRAALSDLISRRRYETYIPIRLTRFDGLISNINISLVDAQGDGREDLIFVGVDVTDLYRATTAVRSREKRLQRLLEATVDPIVTVDSSGDVVQFNQAAARAFEYATGEVIGRRLDVLLPEPGLTERILGDEQRTLPEGEERETEGRAKPGRTFPCSVSSSRYRSCGRIYTTLIVRDITSRKSFEEQLRFLALIDPLTGLPNRAHLLEKLDAVIDAKDGEVGLIGVDIDRLRAVNDAFGHGFGDRLIAAISRRLLFVVGENDFLARVGGDDFLIIVGAQTEEHSPIALAERTLNAFSDPFALDGIELYVTVSIGVAMGPEHGANVASLMRNVESATYHAKNMGRGNYQTFSNEIANRQEERLLLEHELRRAIDDRGFELFYQPKVLTETGEIIGMEALMRWTHRDLGTILPAEFIPIAESSGLISVLGQWLIDRACKDTAQWVAGGYNRLRCAINISPLQFRDSGLADRITGALADSGLNPRHLEIEITESGLMDEVEHVIGALRTLKNAGLSIAVDDFGTGYSSLAYLKRFPLDTLKIDQSFIRGIPDDRDDVSIASAIISMGQSLDLDIVAEGVENQDQVDFLLQHRCRVAQGFLFGAPMAAVDFGRYLEAARSPDSRAAASGMDG